MYMGIILYMYTYVDICTLCLYIYTLYIYTFLQRNNICFNMKYVAITGKNSFYRQHHVFSLMVNILPFMGKIVFTRKNTFFLN